MKSTQLKHTIQQVALIGSRSNQFNRASRGKFFSSLKNTHETSEHLQSKEFNLNVDIRLKQYFENPRITTGVSLIHNLISSGRVNEALKVYSSTKTCHYQLNNKVITKLMNACIKQKKYRDAKLLFQSVDNPDVFLYTCMMKVLIAAGQIENALNLMTQMKERGVSPNSVTYIVLISACLNSGNIPLGLKIADECSSADGSLALKNTLIHLYGKACNLEKAITTFDSIPIPERDIVTWNSLISAFVSSQNIEGATQILGSMKRHGIEPDSMSYIGLISGCTKFQKIQEGIRTHQDLQHSKCKQTIALKNALINMYVQFKQTDIAIGLAKRIPEIERDIFTWNTMIRAFLISSDLSSAEQALDDMQQWGVKPDSVTFSTLISSLTDSSNTKIATRIIEKMTNSQIHLNEELKGSLMKFYSKQGQIRIVEEIFHSLPNSEKSVPLWNTLLGAYIEAKQVQQVADCFNQMKTSGIQPDSITYTIMLSGLARVGELKMCERMILNLPLSAFEQSRELKHVIMNVYGKVGQLEKAKEIFDSISGPDTVSFNTIIGVYTATKSLTSALQCFETMKEKNIRPDAITFTILLSSCVELHEKKTAFDIYNELVKSQLRLTVELKTTVLRMLSTFGQLDLAIQLFNDTPRSERTLFMWTELIAAHAAKKDLNSAISTLFSMEEDGLEADQVIYTILLSLCADLKDKVKGEEILRRMRTKGVVESNGIKIVLIHLYATTQRIKLASAILESLPTMDRSTVAFNSIISGYVEEGDILKAEKVVKNMIDSNVYPDCVTFTILLSACADTAVLHIGERILQLMLELKIRQSIELKNTIVDMYSKCGNLEKAVQWFNKMEVSERTIVSWTVLIGAYGFHGEGRKALKVFWEIERHYSLEQSTITSILTACSHSGLVEEALEIYQAMEYRWGIIANEQHTTCMIDVLGRFGRLDEAEKMLNRMKRIYLPAIFALLGACKTHLDVARAERQFKEVTKHEATHATPYILMSNIYDAIGKRELSDQIRRLMDEKGIKKIAGKTWVEVHGHVHTFLSDDAFHPKIVQIRQYLDELIQRMKQIGYIPDKRWVRADVVDKEKSVCLHSEKLAMAYAIMETTQDKTITIYKNLRVCTDCHEATKFMAKVTNREIFVRDCNRYHHFTPDGRCSCNDYW